MQLAAVMLPYDSKEGVVTGEPATVVYCRKLPVRLGAKIYPWVEENQGELLAECRTLDSTVMTTARSAFFAFLKNARRELHLPDDALLFPAGWCLRSDLAYLMSFMGDACDQVHYITLDLQNLGIAIVGDTTGITKPLGTLVGQEKQPEADKHDALKDAEFTASFITKTLHYLHQQRQQQEQTCHPPKT